jgi:hypothetical protein
MFDQILSLAAPGLQSDIFAGGLALGLLGAGLGLAHRLVLQLWALARRRFVASIQA